MNRRGVRSVPAMALLVGLLGTLGLGRPAWSVPRLSVGGEILDFRDSRLSSTYPTPLGLSLSGTLVQRRWAVLSLQLSVSHKSNEPSTIGFIPTAKTHMTFVPLRLQYQLRHAVLPALVFGGGPQLAWALYREEWEVSVPEAGVFAKQRESGTWLGVGGLAEATLNLGSGGGIRIGVEWVWSKADRRAAPGKDTQSSPMTAGWSGLRLAWEVPWFSS